MSSAVYLKYKKPIALRDWQQFCDQHAIKYSPNTIGWNVWYRGDTEVTFGESRFDGSRSAPTEAYQVNVSTFFMGNLQGVQNVVHAILDQWPDCNVDADSELRNKSLKRK